MRQHLRPLTVALSFLGLLSTVVCAEPATNQPATNQNTHVQQAQAISLQTKYLEAQLNRLQLALNSLKKNTQLADNNTSSTHNAAESNEPHHKKVQSKKSVVKATKKTEAQQVQPEARMGADSTAAHIPNGDYLPFDMDVPGKAFVSTGPYVNVPIQYSGSNLIVNSPSVNTDVTLLNIRKAILVHLNELNGNLVAEPDHSHLLLSGIIEGQASYLDDSGGPNRSDIDVTNVTLDSFILGPSDWLLGLVELTYDNGGGSFREADSRVLVNKAFVTFGNFKVSPWYGTFGQFYVPFGTYSSVMISDTLPKLLTRTKARSVLVGFQQQENNAFYGAAYIFSGDAHVGASPRVINNGGLNAGYRFVTGDEFFSGNVGGGVIGDISDSGGMQAGNGFGNSAAAERIKHHVPGYNARGLFSIGGKVDVIMEWVGASTAYSPLDMTYNDQGAKPWALDTQIAYSFYMFENKPFSAGLGYAMTHQALSLGLPKKRYSVVLNSSMWRNTLQSIEFRHDVGYSRGSTATGALGEPVGTTIPPRGGMDNAVTVLFDYYF